MVLDDRRRILNYWYYANIDNSCQTNDDATEIIAQPDRFLLNQNDVFEAQGGW